MPACAHVAQSVCSQVPYDMHTHTGTNFGEGAQLSAQENKLLAMRAGGMDSTSPTRRVMQNLPARTRLQLRASCATGPAASGLPALWPTCCHCPATPAIPRPTSCCALLCRTICAWCTSQSHWLLGPPGRLCALVVGGGQEVDGGVHDVRPQSCSRVGCRLLFGCLCFRLQGPVFLPLQTPREHLVLLARGLPWRFVLCASGVWLWCFLGLVLVRVRLFLDPSRSSLGQSLRACREEHTHTTSTPHHIHSSYTTIPTNLSTLPLVLVHTSLGWCTVYCMPWMHFVLIDQV
jgi:hypothetical protein